MFENCTFSLKEAYIKRRIELAVTADRGYPTECLPSNRGDMQEVFGLMEFRDELLKKSKNLPTRLSMPYFDVFSGEERPLYCF